MATQVFSGTATIGTTPFSLPNGSTTLTPITAADDIGAVVEFTSLAVGDRFQVEVLDKTASSGGTQRSLFKLICVGDERRVVGIHLLGDAADEILQGFAVALKMGATLDDLHDTIAIHPTSAEEVVLMR